MRPTATSTGGVAMQGRRSDHFRSREARAGYARVWIACALFFILLGAGWMIGTKFHVTSPPDEARTMKPAERAKGRIVTTAPDGMSCSYTAFDNVTQQVGTPTTASCDEIAREQRGGARREFQWGRSNSDNK